MNPEPTAMYGPRGGPIERWTARVIPVSLEGRVLLLQGHDPAFPDAPYWFSIGGGVEVGESTRAAAVRELHEEVGVRVTDGELIGPIHRRDHGYSYDGSEYLAHSTFFTVRLPEARVDGPRGMPGEVITEAHWWTLDELPDIGLAKDDLAQIARIAVEAVAAAVTPASAAD